MKDIEKIIQENRPIFDSFEPDDGHLERFEQKLARFNKKQHSFSFGLLLKAAAIAILVVISGLWVYDRINPTIETRTGLALHQLSPEYNEVEIYYATLASQKLNEISSLEFVDSTQKTILLNELKQMDAVYENLKRDLKKNPSDERVINAMIQHYQMKVDIMNQILNQLHQVKALNQQKSDNYESTEI
ncbi:MAG: hypothetical protein A2W99_04655 [Bacteroidetes bacterium GWF2_33_16]|nr:MAG: hypothetical protein A2X00_17175 [Bacteroidetes bacterium GWE2_32_14]OFY05959.1 MAG: hypothetical protein A2W99_04655 [Bacteroidetes bacterium GWF2_33_16]